MRTYRQVTEPEPKITEFLLKHRDRLTAGHFPRGLWVCEEDGNPIFALTVYTEPFFSVAAIMDKAGSFQALRGTVKRFEDWCKDAGINHYSFMVHASDDHYCRLVEHYGAVEQSDHKGWRTYLRSLDQAPLEDGVRPWDPRDWKPLRRLVRSYLDAHPGGAILPTRRNVEMMIRSGVQTGTQGGPAVVAQAEGALVGYCLWVPAQPTFDLATKPIVGLGTYVEPSARRAGWSKKMREKAVALARAQGYDYIEGVAFDKAGLDSSKAAGFVPRGVLVRYDLTE